MKKKKEKKKERQITKFNSTDYEYMDNLPLVGWMWEFIRRSEAYQSLYSKICHFISIEREGQPVDYDTERKAYSDFTAEIEDIGLIPLKMPYKTQEHDDYTLLCEECQKKGISLPTNSSPLIRYGYFIYCFERWHSCWFHGIPDPALGYFRLRCSPTINGLSYLKCKSYDDLKKIPDWVLPSPLSVLLFLSPSDIPEDTIYVGIRKDAKISDIEKKFIPTIKDYLKPKKSRRRDEKWKYYLIVYDLVKEEMSYSEISEILITVYPEYKSLFDLKNIENYYKNALVLIEGGYKKYL
ncbi:MAG: hypothetical protein IBX72_06975 [Nitrospirae bacterium]|nr:hypothetical protein [Nitrospirota bacterium]